MKLVYLHQSRETVDLVAELFATRSDFTIKVESNRRGKVITTFEDTAGSWTSNVTAKIKELEASGRITVIDNSEPADATWRYYEVKHEYGFE